jgi:hypothetical protein
MMNLLFKLFLSNWLALFVPTPLSEEDEIFSDGFDPCDPQQQCCASQVLFSETFSLPDGSSWGGQWQLPGF